MRIYFPIAALARKEDRRRKVSRMANTSVTRHEPLSLYEEHFDALVSIGVNDFGLDEHVARMLADRVLLSSLGKRQGIDVDDTRSWLIAAMTWASRIYIEQEVAADPRVERA